MRTGNVIRDPGGSLWIVTDVYDHLNPPTVEAISFDSENVSAVQQLDDHERVKTCLCGDHPDFMGEPQEDCEKCQGRGSYTEKIVGWKHSKVLAPCVKDYILNAVKKGFGLR